MNETGSPLLAVADLPCRLVGSCFILRSAAVVAGLTTRAVPSRGLRSNGAMLGCVLPFLALAFLPDALAAQQCPRGTLTGNVTHVRYGDTVEVGGMAIRLHGIAAPELDESGGEDAAKALRAMALVGRQINRPS